MNWPSISVVIPSFNQGAYLERTLLSILRQDYPGRVEVIVSDGGSKDSTLDVLARYPQVTWWSRRDSGIADATNRALSVATGEVIAIQSSDDFYLRDAFRLTVDALRHDKDLGIASGCDVYLQPGGTGFTCSQLDDHEVSPRSLLMRRVIPQHCAFFRREVYERVGPLRTCIAEGAEVDFWYRALHFVRGQFVPHHTAAYQVHPAQRTRTSDRWYESQVRMVETCEDDLTYGRIFRLSTSDKRDLYARWEILQEHRAGRIASAIELIDRLMQSDECTEETLSFLATHGLIPRTGGMRTARRHPNHRIPDFGWYLTDGRAEQPMRAVA